MSSRVTRRHRVCAAVVLTVVFLAGCNLLRPSPQILSKDGEETVFTVNDELDAGYRVTCIIKNNGASGRVKVEATVFCSEGTFKDSQTLEFKKSETKQVVFRFAEPSWMASNYKYIVETDPPSRGGDD